jgi:hypothetical protein
LTQYKSHSLNRHNSRAWSAAVALFGAMLGEGPDRNTTGRSEYQKI